MKHLQLLRHGSAAMAPTSGDVDRQLTETGRGQARAVGRHMTNEGIVPAQALVSTARRTRETYELASAAGGWSIPHSYETHLYNGSALQALEELAAVPADANRVLMVGHQPTLASLADHLVDDHVSLTTGTLVEFAIDIIEWFELLDVTGPAPPARLAAITWPHQLDDDLFRPV